MLKKAMLCAICLAVIGLAASPIARAQEEEEPEWSVLWSNGHKMDSSDGAFKMKFGGRIQADYIWASQDSELDELLGEDAFQDGFQFRRARLFFEGSIYERFKFKAQYDFAGGDVDFKDVWIAIKTGGGDLKFGHFKEPISLNELTSSKYLGFLERALPVEIFTPSRNSGIGYSGSNDRFFWGVGYFYDADDFAVSIDEDRTNASGRFVWRPFYDDGGKKLFHFGVDASLKEIEDGGVLRFRGRPGNAFGPRPVDTGGLPAEDATLLGFELAGVWNRFWYAAEYYQMDVTSPPIDEFPEDFEIIQLDPSLDGYYIQAGFFLTDDYRRYKKSSAAWDRQKPSSSWTKADGGRGAWEIALRYAEADLSEATDPGELSNITFAINWYPNPATRLMFNYVTADVSGGPLSNNVDGSIDSFLVRWQIDF
jgi:phosphate-selective porin OprO/OprP